MTKQVPQDYVSMEWYVWTVRAAKFDLVKSYIEDNIPAVKRVLYPTVTMAKASSKGDVHNKKIPLYAGYMFLQYEHNLDNPITWVNINKHPFVTGYVGPCTAKDLASVDSLQKVETLNDDKVSEFKQGVSVKVVGGVFVNFVGTVSYVTSNTVGVNIESSGRLMKVVFSPKDLIVVVGG